MKNSNLFPFQYMGSVTDVNNANKTGFYLTVHNAANSPSFFCVVIVFALSDRIFQMAKELTAYNNFFVRVYGKDSTPSAWSKVLVE